VSVARGPAWPAGPRARSRGAQADHDGSCSYDASSHRPVNALLTAPGGTAAKRPAGAAPLDLHEGISDPRALGCKRWPEHLYLLNQSTGELVQGRCRATNLCRYCQTLYVVETVEMLTLDAVENAPTIYVVLTAREHLARKDTYRHLEQLRRAARKRWPDVEWFVQVEFQKRGRLHLNLLVKGVRVEDRQALHETLVSRWCGRVDALPVGQWSDAIADGEGVVKYLAKTLSHGLKNEQAPPLGWRGHRTSQTRGYLVRPAGQMREEARQALRLKRLLWRGYSVEDAELELAVAVTWSLYSTGSSELRWADTGRKVVAVTRYSPAAQALVQNKRPRARC